MYSERLIYPINPCVSFVRRGSDGHECAEGFHEVPVVGFEELGGFGFGELAFFGLWVC